MKENFNLYLSDLPVGTVITDRIEQIISFYEKNFNVEILDIFITDFINKDNQREFENLWLISKEALLEAKSFQNKDDFDFTFLTENIYYWRIEKQDYNFIKATTLSRLFIKIDFYQQILGELKASGNNCDHLKEIFIKYFIPNIQIS